MADVSGTTIDGMGLPSNAGRTASICQRLPRTGALSPQYLPRIARGGRGAGARLLFVADVGDVAARACGDPRSGRKRISRSAVSQDLANFTGGVLGKFGAGRHELSVCEWSAVHNGGNARRSEAEGRVVLTIAYLAIKFPAAVEPYVAYEIEELRSRVVRVVTGSVLEPQDDQLACARCAPEIVLQSLSLIVLLRALWLCMREWKTVLPLVGRAILQGGQPPSRRIKALAHTWLGACYAVLLKGKGVDHIHVHHGYFGSWIAMVAARLLNTGFSMTLHGSDLLLHNAYLDLKLESCSFCTTISEYNRRYILEHYPRVDAAKVIVAHMGVQISDRAELQDSVRKTRNPSLRLLAVGRLHAVKDHAFLVEACAQLRSRNVPFQCSIAGEGPERRNLEALIRESKLEKEVSLLGHIAREQMACYYDDADVVVLT